MKHFRYFPGVIILGIQWPRRRHLVGSIRWARGENNIGLHFNLGIHPAEPSPHAVTKALRDARQAIDGVLGDK